MAEIRHFGSWCQNAKTRFSKKVSNSELRCLLTTYRGFVYSVDADGGRGRELCVFGGLCVDMWQLVHQWSFLLSWLSFDCFWLFLLVRGWYSLGRHVTIGTPMVIFAVLTVLWLVLIVFDDWFTVGTVLVHLWRLVHCWYQTNRQKQSKTVKRQSKQQKWPLVYQSSHVYTESAEYTKPL